MDHILVAKGTKMSELDIEGSPSLFEVRLRRSGDADL
jgi:hypothetical protein